MTSSNKLIMNTSRIFLLSLAFRLIPETRFFGFKRMCLRWAGVDVADHVHVCSSFKVFGSGNLSIGENTWVGHECMIVSSCSVQIGANVDIAPRVYIGTGTHELDVDGARSAGVGKNQPVTIGDGAWLGAGCLILPGVTIGEKVVVAAGAVVVSDVQPYTLVGGVPARLIKQLR